MSFQWSAAAAAGLMQRSSFGASDALKVVSRRAVEDGASSPAEVDPAGLVWFGLVLLNVITWLPVLIFLGYTLNSVLPVLAVVEDDAPPPAYEPVSLKESSDEKLAIPKLAEEPVRSQTGPITSNLGAIIRLLYAEGGFRSLFKGMGCAFVTSLASSLASVVAISLMPFLPYFVALLVGQLATVQLSAAWVHVVISTRNPHAFWRRLPSFKAAFRATALPTVIASLAVYLTFAVTEPLYDAMGVKHDGTSFEMSGDGPCAFLKILVVPFVQLLITLLIAVPANVVLFRCQGSLLPEGEQTIVPFDRTFQLESVRDRGHASMVEVWKTFSCAAWKRLVKLYIKVTAVTIVTEFAIAAVIIAQFVPFMRWAQTRGN